MTAGKQPDEERLNNKQTSSAASKNQTPSALRVRRPFSTTRFASLDRSAQMMPAGQPTGEVEPMPQQELPPEPTAKLDPPAPPPETPTTNPFASATTSALEELAKLTPSASTKSNTHLGKNRRLRPMDDEYISEPTETAGPPTLPSPPSTGQYMPSAGAFESTTPVVEKPQISADPITPFPFKRAQRGGSAQENPITPLPVPAPWLSNLRAGMGTASPAQEQTETRKASSPASEKKQAKTAPLAPLEGKTDAMSFAEGKAITQSHPTTLLPETNRSTTVRLPESSFTGILPLTVVDSGTTSSIKLPGPMRVVQMPVAGQPGRFVTGFLPVLPQEEPEPEPSSRLGRVARGLSDRYQKINRPMKVVFALSAALILIAALSSPAWLFRGPGSLDTASVQQSKPTPVHLRAADVKATATAQADLKNTLLFDPLSTNIHSWTVSNKGPRTFVFKNGAYHIFNNDDTQGATAILHDTPPDLLKRPLGYSLTMQEVKGDDGSVNNTFGLVIRFTQQSKNGKTVTKFYSFEVVNKKGGEYQFWKYDDSVGSDTSPWKSLWKHNFGKEFHQGQGAKKQNIFKIYANGKKFILSVNGKQVGTLSDGAVSTGEVGMLVNLKGTEVAFSSLKLTAN